MNGTRRASDVAFKRMTILGITFLPLIVYVFWPNFIRNGRGSPLNVCINNLRQLDAATQHWAIEHERKPGDAVGLSDVMSYINTNNRIVCPQGGKYTVGPTATNVPTCSIPHHKLPP